jgi:hypothetical protein
LYSDGKFLDVGSDADETSPLAVSKLSDDANRAYQELTLAMNGLGYVKQDAAK